MIVDEDLYNFKLGCCIREVFVNFEVIEIKVKLIEVEIVDIVLKVSVFD